MLVVVADCLFGLFSIHLCLCKVVGLSIQHVSCLFIGFQTTDNE